MSSTDKDGKPRLMEITPQMATAWIEKMGDANRPVSQTNVDYIAAQIQSGLWRVNGETIVIDEDGKVIDGQHRLWAIVQAGKPVSSWVIMGIPRSVFPTFDSGKGRSSADALHIARLDGGNAGRLAAALAWVKFWESSWTDTRIAGRRRSTPQEAIALAKKYPGLGEFCSTSSTSGVSARLRFHRGNLVFLRWATYEAKPTIAKRFWQDVEEGLNLSKDDPAYQLREKLQGLSTMYGKRVDAKVVLALGIKAWNAAVRGERIAVLRFTEAETFPDIVGFPCPTKVKSVAVKEKAVAVAS